MKQEDIARAAEMLLVAADYILKNFPGEDSIYYDGAELDGYRVADDCAIAAAQISEVQA